MRGRKLTLVCAHCKYTIYSGQNFNPETGDIQFCNRCQNVNQYDKQLKLCKIDVKQLPFESAKDIETIKHIIKNSKFVSLGNTTIN